MTATGISKPATAPVSLLGDPYLAQQHQLHPKVKEPEHDTLLSFLY
jgi:hypothetical protein